MANYNKRIPDGQKRKVPLDRQLYIQQWDKEHTKQVMFKMNKNTDEDILQRLSKMNNKQGYFKVLFRNYFKILDALEEASIDTSETTGKAEYIIPTTIFRNECAYYMLTELKMPTIFVKLFVKTLTDADEIYNVLDYSPKAIVAWFLKTKLEPSDYKNYADFVDKYYQDLGLM